ncbi:MAG: molecular chaperone SurA [Gammaproteobacteria bacterium]|nr:MAG: molecular chaperone SurA [Gammaproteobacteria bacterium]
MTLNFLVRRLAALVLILTCATPNLLAAADGIVAIVNDDVILRSELELQIDQITAEMMSRGTSPPPREALIPQLLNREIEQRIQLQIAARTGIEVSDEALNLTLENIAERNQMSLSELREAVAADDLNFETFREDIRTEMIVTHLRQRDVVNRIDVSAREIDAFLARQATLGDTGRSYHLRHIMLGLDDGATNREMTATELRGQELLNLLNAGANFSQLAIDNSDGQNALQGGDLGWRELGTLPDLFAEAASKLQVGEHSGLLASSSGLHILYLEAIQQGESYMVTQRHARHILIKNSEYEPPTATRQKIITLRQRIEVGEDFAELARAHSDDPGSAIRGGDLGWVVSGQMVESFDTTMNNLAVGEISEPVQSEFGWHLIQLLEIREIDDTLEQQRRRAAAQIRSKKSEQEIKDWLRRMRDEAFVEIRI